MLATLPDAKVMTCPEAEKENLCLDAAFAGKKDVVTNAGYVPHILPGGGERKEIIKNPDFKPHRWVVELSHSWFNRFRKLSPRYEKTTRAYMGLLMLAAAMITMNKVITIYG